MRLNQLVIFLVVAILMALNSCAEAGDPFGPQQPCKPDTVFINNFDFDPMIIEVHDTVQIPVFLVDSVFVKDTVLVEFRNSYTDYGFTLDLLQLWVETDRSHQKNGYKQHDARFILAGKFHVFKYVNVGGFLLYEDTEYHSGQGVEGVSVGIGANLSGLRFEADYLYGKRFKERIESYWLHGFNAKALYRVSQNISIGPSVTWLDYTSSSESYPFLAVRLNL